MILSMIAAVGKNRELGQGHLLPWDIPEDMKYFQDTTRGHVVLMGEKTYRAIGKPLPQRTNIVLTHERAFSEPGVLVAHTPEEALDLMHTYEKNGEAFVIGGASVYTLFLEEAKRLYLTLIDKEFPDADIFFPEYESVFYRIVKERKSGDDTFSYRFVVFEK